MEYPTYATITVNKRIKLNIPEVDKDYFEREGYSNEDVLNTLEYELRSEIWEHIDDKDIKILFQ